MELQKRTYTYTPSVNDAVRHRVKQPALRADLRRAKGVVVNRPKKPLSVAPVDLGARRPRAPAKRLETFPNPSPQRDYEIRFECPEFTCLCPMTGQPDFATIRIAYTPDKLCVELKSLKLYLWSFRDEGAFHEAVTNGILDDLVAAVKPRKAEVTGDFFVRGGIHTVVVARHP
jgi:7-cyano-7-deazaguanine reductase